MAGRGLAAERNELIEAELRGIRETLGRLEKSLAQVSGDLGTVRIGEMSVIRAKLAELELAMQQRIAAMDAQLAVLQYQSKRSGAAAGAWISAVISVAVGAGAALLMHR